MCESVLLCMSNSQRSHLFSVLSEPCTLGIMSKTKKFVLVTKQNSSENERLDDESGERCDRGLKTLGFSRFTVLKLED